MQVTLGSVQSIPEGEGRCFDIGERRLAVFRCRNGRVFAVQAACPHKGGPLADGLVGGDSVICPLHALRFDLETGKSSDGTCSLATYPAALGPSGQIVVEIARD